MKIVYLASEVAPLAKTGGLADVAGALPAALKHQGHEVILFLPKYRLIKNGPYQPEKLGLNFSIPIGTRKVDCSIEKMFLPDTDIPVFLVACDAYFNRDGLYQESGRDYPDNLERFTLFNRAVLETLKKISFKPDVIHANDWQTALVPIYLKTLLKEDRFFSKVKTLYTIHNLAYQGTSPKEQLPLTGLGWDIFHINGLEFYDTVNLMKGGLIFSDQISTVSRRYSEEIQTADFGCGLDGVLKSRKADLTGILNGVDYGVWNPETDPLIACKYSARDWTGKADCKRELQQVYGLPQLDDVPVLGVISRLADQKGFDILAEMFDYLMAFPVQFVLLGTGDPEYHRLFESMAKRFPEKCGIALKFDNRLAHQIEAGSDFFLMPSRYEPCGLNQMYSLKYGTIPVVRATGGLADTVVEYDPKSEKGNGFVFQEPDPKEFFWAIMRGRELYARKPDWIKMVVRAMQMDFSWDRSAKEYIALYEKMVKSSTTSTKRQAS